RIPVGRSVITTLAARMFCAEPNIDRKLLMDEIKFDASEINEVNLPSSSRKKNSLRATNIWLTSLHEIEKKSGERHEYARSSRQRAKNGNHTGRDESVAQSDCGSR